MPKKVQISFSREKFNIFSHILSEICDDKYVHWQENQIGIKFTKDGFLINEKDMSNSILLHANFPKASTDSAKLEDFFIAFDTTRFLNGLKFCNRVKEKYDVLEISFTDNKIEFLSNAQSGFDIRANYDGKPSQFGDINLPIKLEDVNKEDFKNGLYLVNLTLGHDTVEPTLTPIKMKVENNHCFIESTTDMNLAHGKLELDCKQITPKNTNAEILLSDDGLHFVSKLAEKAQVMDFYFMEEGAFRANLSYDYGITANVCIARRSD